MLPKIHIVRQEYTFDLIDKKEYKKGMDGESNNSGWIILFVIVIVFVGIKVWEDYSNKPEYVSIEGISSYTTAKRNGWELSLYSSKNPNTDYLIDEIKGLMSKNSCISEGITRKVKSGSFECSYKCKTIYTDVEGSRDKSNVCEKVCNEAGDCRD